MLGYEFYENYFDLSQTVYSMSMANIEKPLKYTYIFFVLGQTTKQPLSNFEP